jgi:hypothetical protein
MQIKRDAVDRLHDADAPAERPRTHREVDMEIFNPQQRWRIA